MQSPIKSAFRSKSFNICEDIYEPAEDSFLFAENLDVPKGAEVLDVGTGSAYFEPAVNAGTFWR